MPRQGEGLMDGCVLNVLRVVKGKVITTHSLIQFLSALTC